MKLTEQEILSEFDSIKRSLELVIGRRDQIESCFDGAKKIWFIGCGSSYCLAKSMATMFTLRCGIASFAAAAGDMMLHMERYRRAAEDSVLVFISRSGMTTEVLRVFELASKWANVTTMVLCAREDSRLIAECDHSLCVPWAFDESVCQTKNIGSFYAALAMICAVLSKDEVLTEELRALSDMQDAINRDVLPLSERIARKEWNNVVVLGDAEASGLMEEGALAFKEISCLFSNFYNLLDVRHGPIVVVDKSTFVFALAESFGETERSLLEDIAAKTDNLLSVGPFVCEGAGDRHYTVERLKDPISYAIVALYILQNVALQKAYVKGTDPDEPQGLNAWVKL